MPQARPLDRAKFRDPLRTARAMPAPRSRCSGSRRCGSTPARLCNLACKTCYIESSPTNDALVYPTLAEVDAYLDEAEALGTREIGFTGGEPFMNPDMLAMMRSALARGFEVLVLTNAMRPMRRFEAQLDALRAELGARLTMRVSLDHYTQALHEAERGAEQLGQGDRRLQMAVGSWLSHRRSPAGDWRERARRRRARAMPGCSPSMICGSMRSIPPRWCCFPEMDATADVPEISEACWDLLGVSPASMMCASSRMVVKRKGAPRPVVVACT